MLDQAGSARYSVSTAKRSATPFLGLDVYLWRLHLSWGHQRVPSRVESREPISSRPCSHWLGEWEFFVFVTKAMDGRSRPLLRMRDWSGSLDLPLKRALVGPLWRRALQDETHRSGGYTMFRHLRTDIKAVFDRDPAARSWLEVLTCYPGLHALQLHRIAHFFYRKRLYFFARLISHTNRFITGIEIHPGAKIGQGVFIDHGMGVVIGETTEIGNNVTLYQGVVLGGSGKEKGKRHPTIGDNVVIAAGAKILGSFRVGDHAKIGAGAVVLREVPPNSTVVGIPGRVVKENGRRVEPIDLDHCNLPDPVERLIRSMQSRIDALESRVRELDGTKADTEETIVQR